MTPLLLDEDQQMLADMARDVIGASAPLSRVRARRDAGVTHDAALWAELVDLGWAGVTFGEDDGGLGMGLAEAVVLTEAMGRNLAPSPLLSTLMAGALDTGAGIQDGRLVSLAWREHPRRADPAAIEARFSDGTISGAKRAVLDANAAEAFVVSALDGDRIALFRVEAAHAGVTARDRIDGRDVGDVVFYCSPATRLTGGLTELTAALDAGAIALAAEMLGGAEAALEMTISYLKEREQFGAPIGSFQALQHRVVDCFVAIELARSAVMAAAREPTSLHASLAKATCGDAYLQVANEAIQLHGGIGMTDEHDIGFFLKRAKVADWTLGDAAWHRDRWGRLRGY